MPRSCAVTAPPAIRTACTNRYIGFTAAHKLYVSSKAPTEAGTYRQTAYIFGGNDMAKSISRTVTITAD